MKLISIFELLLEYPLKFVSGVSLFSFQISDELQNSQGQCLKLEATLKEMVDKLTMASDTINNLKVDIKAKVIISLLKLIDNYRQTG